MTKRALFLFSTLLLACPRGSSLPPPPDLGAARAALVAELVAKHGEAERPRIERGVSQVSSFWRAEDGDAAAFARTFREGFLPAGAELDKTFARFEAAMEQLDGHFVELGRYLRYHAEVDTGPMAPID